MPRTTLKFGTDGWRAVIADGYTFENVRRAALGTARWLLSRKASEGPSTVVIGYDARFLGQDFARAAAEVFASSGIRVIFAARFVTTPAVSWGTEAYGADLGVVITASHNPPEYNGYKLKAHYGGPTSPEEIAEVEAAIAGLEGELPHFGSFDRFAAEGVIEIRDIGAGYLEILAERIDVEAIRRSGVRLAYDAMFGAGQGIITQLLGAEHVVELHHDHNPGFHGRAPEPIERNLPELPGAVTSHGCAAGLATDGDADRIAMYDEHGNYVDSHRLLSLLVYYLHREKGLSGDVVKTFSTTDMLDKMARRFGLKVHTTPIGFKYIAAKMREADVLVGGEESGGMAVKGHIPERDGIYIGLLVVEMMVKRQMKLSELVQELFDEFGPHVARRSDLHTTEAVKQAVLHRLNTNGLDAIGGYPVEKVERIDGHKFRTPSGWVMFRASGTEPVLRIYTEASTAEQAESLLQAGVDFVHAFEEVGV